MSVHPCFFLQISEIEGITADLNRFLPLPSRGLPVAQLKDVSHNPIRKAHGGKFTSHNPFPTQVFIRHYLLATAWTPFQEFEI